jgi:hypothetical protein
MRKYFCPIKRTEYLFEENEVLNVYVKRSNGKRKLLNSFTRIQDAFEFFHSFKVFQNDYKYLIAVSPKSELKILIQRGEGERNDLHKGRYFSDRYARGIIPQVMDVPCSLLEGVKTILDKTVNPHTYKKVSRNSLIPMLLSYFASLTEDEVKSFIHREYINLLNYKIKSGADLYPEVEKLMNNGTMTKEDLL